MTDWQPIETAPRDRRILLLRPTADFDWAKIIVGRFEDDRFATKPKPYWAHDLERLEGKRSTKANQPTHWMPLPAPPTES